MTDRAYILSLIAQGEHEHQDFKYQISDARKIARSISAFANHSGGHLLVGVKDNGMVAGVSSDEEMYMIEQAASLYCRPEQTVHFSVYHLDGKAVVKADIAEAGTKPVKAPDENGNYRAYYRVADENVLASALHVRLMSEPAAENDTQLAFTEREQQLLDYLDHHGGITLTGFSRLSHCSRPAAAQTIETLCRMGVITLEYHDGQCLVVAAENN